MLWTQITPALILFLSFKTQPITIWNVLIKVFVIDLLGHVHVSKDMKVLLAIVHPVLLEVMACVVVMALARALRISPN
jgi:hypothetical protein